MQTLTLDYLGCTVAVSAEEAHLAWLREFLSPPFAVGATSAAKFRVAYTTEPARYVAVFVRGPDAATKKLSAFAFDQRKIEYPRWRGERGEIVLFDAEFRCFYVIGGPNADVEVVAHRDDNWPRVAMMRVVREIVSAHAEAQGSLPVHGAAVRFGANAAILAGPKRSGKTSLLFHALRNPDAELIANDRVFLTGASDAWHVTGMPTVINVRKGTRVLFPNTFASLRDDPTLASLSAAERDAYARPLNGRDDGALVLNPMQLATATGAERADTTSLKAIVLPRVDPDHRGLSLTRLAPEEVVPRLPSALFPSASRLFYSRGEDASLRSHNGVDAPLARLAASVACFECVLGDGAYSDATRAGFFQQLFGSAP
jgi:hypothetical protein